MKFYVRIFQFVRSRLVPLWYTYYICSLFQYIYVYGDATAYNLVWPITFCHDQKGIYFLYRSVKYSTMFHTRSQFLTWLSGREKMHTRSIGPHAPTVGGAMYSQSTLKFQDFLRMWLYFSLLNRVSIFPVPLVYKWAWVSINSADGDEVFPWGLIY